MQPDQAISLATSEAQLRQIHVVEEVSPQDADSHAFIDSAVLSKTARCSGCVAEGVVRGESNEFASVA